MVAVQGKLQREKATKRVAREAQAAVSECDALFAMLDGQLICACEGTWRAEVVGIHDDGCEMWVQVCPARQPTGGVIVRLPSGGHGDLALRALQSWSEIPEGARPHLIAAGAY